MRAGGAAAPNREEEPEAPKVPSLSEVLSQLSGSEPPRAAKGPSTWVSDAFRGEAADGSAGSNASDDDAEATRVLGDVRDVQSYVVMESNPRLQRKPPPRPEELARQIKDTTWGQYLPADEGTTVWKPPSRAGAFTGLFREEATGTRRYQRPPQQQRPQQQQQALMALSSSSSSYPRTSPSGLDASGRCDRSPAPAQDAPSSSCPTCRKPVGDEPFYCTRCKQRAYCSRACRQYDWKFHKLKCKPCSLHNDGHGVPDDAGQADRPIPPSPAVPGAAREELKEGASVYTHGLTGLQADFNDRVGRLDWWDADASKWYVRLEGGYMEALDAENLTLFIEG